MEEILQHQEPEIEPGLVVGYSSSPKRALSMDGRSGPEHQRRSETNIAIHVEYC